MGKRNFAGRMPSYLGSLIVVVVGVIIAVIVVIGPATTENTSSEGAAGRVSIPGTSTIRLSAERYSFWYAIINQNTNGWAGVPPLDFNIVPPGQAAQPSFTESYGAEADVQEFSTERVAYVQPKVSGLYKISVSSSDGPGGVILIGKTLPDMPPDFSAGLIIFVVTLAIAGGILLATSRRGRSPVA
jgi:hypothetical protein